ncbi:MAG TPA: peptide chain release factor N(5)-glutamine methyltransferase [Thermoanaerobaculia bacterium]|nr:peptide chain release factor N(5)-glutamine methyltransferase [Thermoanaerobaculia bacterium]
MRVGELRARWKAAAERRSISPRDVDVLLGDLLERPLSWLLAHEDDEVPPDPARELAARMQRRLDHEPLQYIRGRTEFFGREIVVAPGVLIPRPETEHLVEQALGRIRPGGLVLEVGTGSGCIAISLALERPDLRITATEISLRAAAVAAHNARVHGARVRLVVTDVFEAVAQHGLAAIVSNPPYVPAGDLHALQPEVRRFEPEIALTPGRTGLELIERIVEGAPRLLESDGLILLEIGFSQAAAVERAAAGRGWKARFHDDLAGIPRVAILSR